MTRTERTRNSYRKRLVEAFGDEADNLTWRDYPLVRDELGWCEGTFRTYLKYRGEPTGDLSQSPRTYEAGDDTIETLRTILPSDLVTTLILTGCRFGELWRMTIRDRYLVVRTQKNGREVRHNLQDLPRVTRQLIEMWVNHTSKSLTREAAAKRWQRAIRDGRLPRGCTSHAFRYRAATKLAEAGADICEIADYLGHQNLNTTRGYVSRNTLAQKGVQTLL